MYQYYNPNPFGSRVGDCAVRAISKALGKTWDEAYLELCIYGLMYADLPSANAIWGRLLHDHGFTKHIIPDTCPDCMTVERFVAQNHGTAVIALNGHVVTAIDETYFDSWDSGKEVALYFWRR